MQGDELDLVESLPAIFDEPFGDSSALPSYRLMQLARKSVDEKHWRDAVARTLTQSRRPA